MKESIPIFTHIPPHFLESTVDFRIFSTQLSDLTESTLRLVARFSATNMHCWMDGQIKRFDTILDLIAEFVRLRLPYYDARLQHIKSVTRDKLNDRKTRIVFLQTILQSTTMDTLSNAEKWIRSSMKITDDAMVQKLLSTPVREMTKERLNKLIDEKNSFQVTFFFFLPFLSFSPHPIIHTPCKRRSLHEFYDRASINLYMRLMRSDWSSYSFLLGAA